MARATLPSLNIHWHTGDLAGQLINPGTYSFGYVQGWLDHGASLSPLAVPFGLEVHRLRDPAFDGLPGFLADCLPDSWGRMVIEREFSEAGIDANPMRMLAWVGRRGLGALQFAPPMESTGTWETVQPLLLAREAQAVLRNDPSEMFAHLRRAGTAGGAFPKATIALLPDGSMLVGGKAEGVFSAHPLARLGLLKLDVEDIEGRPSTDGRLEAAYMAMARAAGLDVAHCEVRSEDDALRTRHHLFVERFDVLEGGAKRLHLLSLAGALETFRGLTYARLLEATRALTADQTQVLEAVRRMVFNVRAANGDDHGKNHSFTFDRSTGTWALSPAYDLTLNYSQTRSFNGLSGMTFGHTPKLDRMEAIATDYGVTRAQFAEVYSAVVTAISRWNEFADAHAVSPEDRQRAAQAHADVDAILAQGASHLPRSRRRRW